MAPDYIARVKALAPRIAAAVPQIEADRQLPTELVEALHDAGLFRMLLPRSLGGEEMPLPRYVQVIEEIAKIDASTAWCVAQTSGCSTTTASLPPETSREIYGSNPRALLAWGPPNASGKAVAVDGGYRITGGWNYASGSRHATWLGAHCPVFEPDGKPRLNADGTPAEITAVFPRDHATIHDVWHVIGLKGTGSDSYSLNDVFVPKIRTVTAFARNVAEKREAGPLYKFTTFQLFGASFSSIALGIARTTLDAFIELAKAKTPYGGKYLLRDNAVIQARIGFGEAQLGSAKAFLASALDDMWQGALGEGFTLEQRVRLRMASTHATHQAKDVVDACYHAAGASAIFESNPFERRFRDVHTVSQQVQSHYSVFEAIGQHYLGLPLHPRLI